MLDPLVRVAGAIKTTYSCDKTICSGRWSWCNCSFFAAPATWRQILWHRNGQVYWASSSRWWLSTIDPRQTGSSCRLAVVAILNNTPRINYRPAKLSLEVSIYLNRLRKQLGAARREYDGRGRRVSCAWLDWWCRNPGRGTGSSPRALLAPRVSSVLIENKRRNWLFWLFFKGWRQDEDESLNEDTYVVRLVGDLLVVILLN